MDLLRLLLAGPGSEDEYRARIAEEAARLTAAAGHRPGRIPAGPRGQAEPADWVRAIGRRRY